MIKAKRKEKKRYLLTHFSLSSLRPSLPFLSPSLRTVDEVMQYLSIEISWARSGIWILRQSHLSPCPSPCSFIHLSIHLSIHQPSSFLFLSTQYLLSSSVLSRARTLEIRWGCGWCFRLWMWMWMWRLVYMFVYLFV